jgi:hypothetical protein
MWVKEVKGREGNAIMLTWTLGLFVVGTTVGVAVGYLQTKIRLK